MQVVEHDDLDAGHQRAQLTQEVDLIIDSTHFISFFLRFHTFCALAPHATRTGIHRVG
jgi:hypothetical protein